MLRSASYFALPPVTLWLTKKKKKKKVVSRRVPSAAQLFEQLNNVQKATVTKGRPLSSSLALKSQLHTRQLVALHLNESGLGRDL